MSNLLSPNFEAIPTFLRELPYWNAWAIKPRGNGKIGKPPVGKNGKYARVDEPKTFALYDTAKKYYEHNQGKILPGMQGPVAGVGILLLNAYCITIIDLDDCFDQQGNPAVWALPFLKILKDTYCEYSPSGKGLHAYIRGDLPKNSRTRRKDKSTGAEIEVYSHGRFMTVTGRKLDGCANSVIEGEQAKRILNYICEFLNRNENSQENEEQPRAKTSQLHQNANKATSPQDLTDSELLDRARTAKDGRYFKALFDEGVVEKSPSEADLALANKLAFWTGNDAVRIDKLMRLSALLSDPARQKKWDEKHGSKTYGQMTIDKAIAGTKTPYGSFGKGVSKKSLPKEIVTRPDTGRPKIIYRPGELPRLVKEIENSIRERAFQMDDLIVHVVKLPQKRSYHGLRQVAGTSVISAFDAQSLTLLANKCADWVKIKETKDKSIEVAINPPLDVIQSLLSAKGDWTLPVLSGLVTCPIIRPNGTILNKPGYDKETGLYADFNPQNFPPVEEYPSKDEAQSALSVLKDAISEFPFKEDEENPDVNKSVALAGMLTTVLRPSIDHSPLFAFSAPSPRTGKSTLADMLGIMATGKPCSAMDFNKDETEFKKSVFATLLEGPPVVLIDNIVGEINSSLLNMVLSQDSIKGRVLGLSKNANLPTNGLWLATGNNLLITGDLTWRTLFCTLDAGIENPATRRFSRDIYKWAQDHRGELVHAALTILRAFYVAKMPVSETIEPMNGFNSWSKWVRGSLAWLGEADPQKSQKEIESHDPEREALANVLTAWWEHFGSEAITSKDLLKRTPPDGESSIPDTQINLLQALTDAVPHNRELTGRSLGKWLARYEGRVIDKMRFRKSGEYQRSALWKIFKD